MHVCIRTLVSYYLSNRRVTSGDFDHGLTFDQGIKFWQLAKNEPMRCVLASLRRRPTFDNSQVNTSCGTNIVLRSG